MALIRRLYNALRGDGVSRAIEREMRFHMEERIDELVAAGMSPRQARREARRRFGNAASLGERTRDVDVAVWLDSLLADVRQALRGIRGSPVTSAVAILSLALAIGANTAIFSVVDAVLLRSLPVQHPEELVNVAMGTGGGGTDFTNPIWEAVRERSDASRMLAYGEASFDLASHGAARRVDGEFVSGSYFSVLGVQPMTGRLLRPGDDVRGCPATAVISDGLWEREYGRDPAALGRALSLDGRPFTIVGVADPAFTGVDVGRQVAVYVPICAAAIVRDPGMLDNRSAWWIRILARRPAAMSTATFSERLRAIAPAVFAAAVPQDWRASDQAEFRRSTLMAIDAAAGVSQLRASYRTALAVLLGVVGLVLLIACVNVASLQLARGAAREREMATRLALGAGRGRLARQLLTESVVLSVAAAALGLLLAVWGSRALPALVSIGRESVWLDLSVDGRVLAFTTAVAVGTALLFGVAPAWRAARLDPHAAMKAGGRTTTATRSRFALGRTLLVGQLALSLVVVIAAGLLLGSFRKLVTLDPGFRRRGALIVSTDLRKAGAEGERLVETQAAMLRRVRAVPGVRSASASMFTPLSGVAWNGEVKIDGFTPRDRRDAIVFNNGVSDGYFTTMGTRLVAGRDFDAHDAVGAPRVAIVNEAMARKFFGASSPLGRRFTERAGPHEEPPAEIIGVVADAKYGSLREDPLPVAYFTLSQLPDMQGPDLELEIRGDGPPGALVPAVGRALTEVAPAVTFDVRTLDAQVTGSIARDRLLAVLAGFFGALALLLVMIGLYGSMAYAVARRRNEIGIRIALGAERGRVLGMVLGEVGRLVIAGAVLGIGAALLLTRTIASLLYATRPADPATIVLATLLLAAIAALAGAGPAWRAARVDPLTALREE